MRLRRRWIRGGERELTKEAYFALFIHGCFQVAASMSGLFLNLYLWRLTKSLWINGMFNIILYAVTPVAFAIGGWIAKKKDRMVTYRLGIILIAAFFLLVIFAGSNVVTYYPWFAIFYGVAVGWYWTGYIVLMYDVANEKTRARFLAVNMIVFNSAGLLGPVISGYLIAMFKGLQGYIVTFALACALFATAAIFSTKISKVDTNRRTFYLNFSLLMMRRNPQWLKGLLSFFVMGLFQGTMLFLPNILLYQAVGREDWVGLLAVFFALITIGTGYLISRRKDRSNVRGELFYSSLLVAAAACFLLFGVYRWSVIAFMMVFSFLNPLTVNTLTSYYYRLMDFLPLKGHFRIESVVIREFFLNAGRVSSIYILILFAGNPASPALPVVLLVMAIIQIGMAGLVKQQTEPARRQLRYRVKKPFPG